VKRDRKSRLDGILPMFVGMDLHKNYLQVATVDDKGKVLENRRIMNNLNQISRFFRNINPTAKVVMESSCIWYNIYEYLSDEKKLDVVLSNPLKTRAIASAKIKTDKLDTVKLANLLRGGYIRMRTKVKNKIHGIILMKGYSNNNNNSLSISHHPFSIKYNEKLRSLNDYRINSYLDIIESLDNQIKDVSKKILLIAKQDEMAKLLMTIP
jgi:transposase